MKVSITEEATTNLTRLEGAVIVRSEGICYELVLPTPRLGEVSSVSRGALAECMLVKLHGQTVPGIPSRTYPLSYTLAARLFSEEFVKVFYKTQHHDHGRTEDAGEENHYQNMHEEQHDRHAGIVPFPAS